MRERKLKLALLVSCSMLFACAPKVNLSEYGEKDLDSKTAQHRLPDYVLNRKKPRIAVLPFDTTNKLAAKCGLTLNAQESIMEMLVKIGTTEVVERARIDKFMEEVKLSVGVGGDVDLSKLGRLGSIDYVVLGSVNSVDVNAEVVEIPRLKRLVCLETAKASLSARVLAFPAGSVMKAMTAEPPVFKLPRPIESKTECKVENACNSLRRAVRSSAHALGKDFIELFPVYGYVYKTMTNTKDPKKRIAFITIGSGDGLKAGDKVDIIEFKEERDPAKGGIIRREAHVTECTVVENELASDKSICIIPEDKAQNVLVKHAVKTKPNMGLLKLLQQHVE